MKLSAEQSLYFECFYIGIVSTILYFFLALPHGDLFSLFYLYCLRLSWPLLARGTFEDTCLF